MDLVKHIDESIEWGRREVSKLTQDILDVHGITSHKVRCFLNNICNIDGATYLEVGVFRGATFCSAIYGNDIYSIAIDNFMSPNLTPAGVSQKIGNYYKHNIDILPQEEFINNVKRFGNVDKTSVYKTDYQTFDFKTLPNVDIIFYDGETKYHDQYVALTNMLPIFSKETILIMDDWNWDKGAFDKFVEDNNLYISYHKELFTSGEDSNDFWNGLGIFLIEK
jgi:outer membrane receptor for monomeric catechols